MPDRVYQSIFDRVERQPQAFAPRLFRRLPAMNGSLRWIAAAAAVVLIAVVGFSVLGRPSDSGIGTQPTATLASPTSSPQDPSGQVPDALKYVWIGETRPVPGSAGQDRSFLDLRYPKANYDTGAATILGSTVSTAAPDRLTFTSTDASFGCAVGETGTYTWSLSPRGTLLTTTAAGDDQCAARAAAFTGTWIRFDGTNIGDLDAATYPSVFFRPFGPSDAEAGHRVDYGQMRYTAPAGWANTHETPEFFILTRQDGGYPNGIFMDTISTVALDDGACTTPDPSVERTPDAMADALSSRAALVVSNRRPVTISGYTGVRLDVTKAPGAPDGCPDGGVPVFASVDATRSNPDNFFISGGQRTRVYLIDIGNGRLLTAEINGADEAAFQALLPEATDIVEGITFRSTAP
jgi:hypothetical protein